MSQPDIPSILAESRTIAVVGWAVKADRPSHWIAEYLEQDAGYQKNASNLAFLKATQKLIGMLEAEGENPANYLSDQSKQVLGDEALRQQVGAKYGKSMSAEASELVK